jgi:hypothetical protein
MERAIGIEYSNGIEGGHHSAACASFADAANREQIRLLEEQKLAGQELAKPGLSTAERNSRGCFLIVNRAKQRALNHCLTQSSIGRYAQKHFGVKPVVIDHNPELTARLEAVEAKLRIARRRH